MNDNNTIEIDLDDILLNQNKYKQLLKPVISEQQRQHGGLTNESTDNENKTSDNNDIIIIDTYNYKTQKNILYGKHEMNPNNYVKFIITAVIKSYVEENIVNKLDNNSLTNKFTTLYNNNKEFTYDDLQQLFNNVSLSCLISNALKAFQHHDLELLIKTHNVFSNPVPLKEGKDTWLDNWSLNGPGYALTFIFNNKYNSSDVVVIGDNTPEQNIFNNTTFKTHDYIRQSEIKNKYGVVGVLKIVNIFRAFLICNHLLPNISNDDNYEITKASDIWETCVKYFPVYYIGANACDWYNDEIAPSIEAVNEFVEHFPNTNVISIVNVSASYQGGGSHWMGLYFTNNNGVKYAKLMCSQSSSWSVFTDNGQLNNRIRQLGFCQENNMVCLQHDPSNCGVYSLLFLYMTVLYNGDIIKAAKAIGVNAKQIKNDDIYGIKHTLFGWIDNKNK